jgi:hypothetical protein
MPKRSQAPELDTVPLCLREQASPFWIILLLVSRDPAQGPNLLRQASLDLPAIATGT